ncbi:Rnf-Nqr domain containing protein [Candidatus Haliotispira prima]|uniref:Rnf-Nqr domain containing protein n=1 Tax=Candidatus Haliotispira prima TaxID=3034016 RepID=A0ABY8ME21_9SPIO|nr:Rnf-Nqr domain containing protein [Candidatus Haliotispira prima]
MHSLGIVLAYIFVTNVVLTRFLGLCPFLGVSKSLSSALGMGGAVTFVLTLASLTGSSLYYFVLLPLHLSFLKLPVFIFVIASLVQFVTMVVRRFSPNLYQVLGIYLPLITTNCAVLGVTLWNVDTDRYNVADSTLAGFAGGLGFTLVLILMAGIRVRLQVERVPRFLQGTPIAFISAGLMALGFSVFDLGLLSNLGLR